MPKRKIDWSQVDWSRKLKDIAAELGCHTDSAAKAKSRAGLTTPRAPVELRKAKRKESMKKDSAKRYAAAKADGRCLKCMKAQADPTHKTCSPCREKNEKIQCPRQFTEPLTEAQFSK